MTYDKSFYYKHSRGITLSREIVSFKLWKTFLSNEIGKQTGDLS